jgi:hypothetical protein
MKRAREDYSVDDIRLSVTSLELCARRRAHVEKKPKQSLTDDEYKRYAALAGLVSEHLRGTRDGDVESLSCTLIAADVLQNINGIPIQPSDLVEFADIINAKCDVFGFYIDVDKDHLRDCACVSQYKACWYSLVVRWTWRSTMSPLPVPTYDSDSEVL